MVILTLLYQERAEEYMLIAYVAAIVGAALGAWVAFKIVGNLSEVTADDVESYPDKFESSPNEPR